MEEGADFLFNLPVSVQGVRKEEQFFTSWFRSPKSNCDVPNEGVGALLQPELSSRVFPSLPSAVYIQSLVPQPDGANPPQHPSVCKTKGFVLMNMKSCMGGLHLMFFCWLDSLSQCLNLND